MKTARTKLLAKEPLESRRLRTAPWLRGDPEWEAVKCNRQSLSPQEAVEECEDLTSLYREMWTDMKIKVNLQDILDALTAKRIPFVLTGAHGIAVWTGRPRATKDVDILVKPGRNYIRTVNALKVLYPQLETRRFSGVTAFVVPGKKESVIDVTYPLRADNEVTLRTAIWVGKGPGRYKIPTLEAALANKYGAMLALGRDPGKRAQDMLDFYWMVRHSTDKGRPPIDLKKLATLGEMVWPGGGGQEIVRLVGEAEAGKIPDLNA